jgi:tetratricopeptide (TPR) repeat protein
MRSVFVQDRISRACLVLSCSACFAGAAAAEDRAQAYYHFSLGQQLRLENNAAGALGELREALKLDPNSAEIRAEVAAQLREAGRHEEAIGEARAAVAANKDSAAAHLILAQLYQQQVATLGEQAFRNAAAEYEEVVRIEPNDGNTLLVLTALYSQLQAHKDAVRTLERYLQLDPGNFEAHLRLGTHHLALGDSERAASSLKKALDLQPNSARAYRSLGDVYAQAQQTDQAILHYRKALEREPRDIRVRLQLGDVLFGAQRHKEALQEAEAVLALDAKNRFGLDLKGRCLRELKDFDGAQTAAERALAADPNDVRAAFLKVTVAEARQDYEAAAKGLEAILNRNRGNEDAAESAANDRVFLARLGLAYQQLARHTEAAEAFRKAQTVGGADDPELTAYRIEALLQAKELEVALREARAARGKFPQEYELAVLEATALHEKGDSKAALQIVDKLRQASPNDPKVLMQAARFHQRARNYRAAHEILKQVRALEPKNLAVLFQLGAVLERQKLHDEAESVFKDALAVQPEAAPVLNYLGYMNADRGVRVEEALALIDKALAIDPENGAYLDSRGWALYRLGRMDEAESALRKAVAKQGNNAVILDHLGDALLGKGAVKEAIDFWKKALAGEDEDGELDRAAVERKIKDAEASVAQKRR